jgi:hypothetical protein
MSHVCEGFKKIHKEDGKSKLMKQGNLRTSIGYEKFLQNAESLVKKMAEKEN